MLLEYPVNALSNRKYERSASMGFMKDKQRPRLGMTKSQKA
jgi:hypothetical protein